MEGACDVTFDKKEFAIVGDAFFASTLMEIPLWLQEAVSSLVTSLNSTTLNTITQYNANLQTAIGAIDVAKNTYDQYVNRVITDQQAFINAVTSLNSTVANNQATIINLLSTYSTTTETNASITNSINASLAGGAIGAALSTLESVMSTQYGATAQRLTTLESTFTDNATQQVANATATQQLQTYTGWGLVGSTPQVIANSKFYQDLTAYLSGTNYDISGSSTLLNFVQATATSVEAKFAYNSVLNINGVYYNSGFGLTSSATSGGGTALNPYNSEFWIQADKFRVKGTNGVDYIYWDSTSQSTIFRGSLQINGPRGVSIGPNVYSTWLFVDNTSATYNEYNYGEILSVLGNGIWVTSIVPVTTSTTYTSGINAGVTSTAAGTGPARAINAYANALHSQNNIGVFTSSYGGAYSRGLVATATGSASSAGGAIPTVQAIGVLSTATGAGTLYDFYAAGTGSYFPFTGSHEILVKEDIIFDVGDILVDVSLFTSKDVSNTIFTAEKSSKVKQPSIGIISGTTKTAPMILCKTDSETGDIIDATLPPNMITAQINAVGEGMINVIGENGNIKNGDLIVTSSTPGKGMKQDDDIVRNYTVAKARGDWTFTSPTEVKMIPCIYLCG